MKAPPLRSLYLLLAACGGWLGMDRMLPDAKGPTKHSALFPISQRPDKTKPSDKEVTVLLTGVRRPGKGGEEMLAALELARQIAPADFVRYLDARRQLPPNGADDVFISAVLRRWLALDPAAAVGWCSQHASHLMADALTEWARRDPAAAEACVLAMPFRGRDDGIAAVAATLALADPQRAIDLLRRGAPEYVGPSHEVFQILARRDTSWLLKAADSLPGNLAGAARNAAVENMARSDFAGAAAWAKSQPDWSSLVDALRSDSIFPAKALAAWGSLPPDLRKEIGAWRIEWGKSDPEGFLKAVNGAALNIPDAEMAAVVSPAVDQILFQGEAKGLQVLQQLLPDRPALWALRLADSWRWFDAPAARAWARQLTDASLRDAVLTKIQEAESPPTEIETYGPRFMAPSFDATGSQMIREREPEEFMAALKKHGSSIGDAEVLEIRKDYPALYARWLTDPEGPGLEEAFTSSFADDWAGIEPAAAATWVASLPDTEEKQSTLKEVAERWHSMAPQQVQKWADALPEGRSRDTVMKAISGADQDRE
ncbi:MAG TPA: hypothetical protein VHM91_00595 [Verrucomicrobiales bacterium]|jgi:hypothetical protein|nr:hypothetical protein [Verrucomicrobiales bacterium]